MGSKI
jgi:enolase